MTKLARYGTLAEMSSQTGIPLEILRAARKNGCDFCLQGRPDLFEFLKWYFSKQLDADDQENWGRRDKRAAALLREHKLEMARKTSIDRLKVQTFINELVGRAFYGELERMAQEFPSTMKGKDEIKIHEEVRRQIDKVKKRLAKLRDEWHESMATVKDE